MTNTKVATIAKEIDAARCKGNWQAIPELARRYKKHNPNGIALEQSIRAEYELIQILATYRKDSDTIELPARLDPNLFKSVQHQISVALGDRDHNPDTELQKQISKVILATCYFESGSYEKALETLDTKLNYLEQSNGYGYVAYLQLLAIRAMSLELLNKNALEAYGKLVAMVNGTSNIVDRTMVDWAEEGLYRGVLYASSDRCEADVPQTMGLVRAYQKACSGQLSTWHVKKRLRVIKFATQYLSGIYSSGAYVPAVDFALTEEGKQTSEAEYMDANNGYKHQLFSIEIMLLYTVYEKILYSITHFPKSGESNLLILEFVNSLAENFKLVGGNETEKRGFVEALNRASLKTFNSPCVTRHLFHALVNLGDYEQAEHALRTYLYLVGLESKTLLDARSNTPALAFDSFGFNTPVPSANEVEELALARESKKSDGPQRSLEVESPEHQIGVLLAAVKMYCQDLSKGTDAVNAAEVAEHVYLALDDKNTILGGSVFRALGVAFSFLASQTFDQDRRPQYHQKALTSLRTSLELDENSWKTYYQMALQLAEMRDINGAIPMISKSLQLNATFLPSWHLLALLCTCPFKDTMKQALKTCEIAFQEAALVFRDTWVDYSDAIAQQVLLQMTQTLLVERIHGADAALISQSSLFQLFGKIVVPELIPDATSGTMLHEAISNGNARYGMVLSGSLGNMEPVIPPLPSSTSAETSRRHRSSSNASSNTTINGRRKSVSSFTGRKFHLAEMFHQNENSTSSLKSIPHVKSNGSLLDPKNIGRKRSDGNAGSMTSLQSTTSMLSHHNTLLQTTATLTRPTTQARLQHQRSCRLLCDLWLLSAESFLKTGKLQEALKAVNEAENVDWTTHVGVWCLLGRIRIAQNQPEKAITAFQKGLVTKPNDVECRVWLAKTYLELNQIEIAEGILNAVTQENGWDYPPAWFYLGEIYKQTNRPQRAKDCLFYALELESTKPIRPFIVLPRFV